MARAGQNAAVPAEPGGRAPGGSAPVRRRRNAEQTRQALLDVAIGRFARDGYSSTTVRDIADEAGVNVALINRYFTSKEGLFEACLAAAVTDLRRESDNTSVAAVAPAMAHRIASSAHDGRLPDMLLLLLRSSGDGRADAIRRDFVHTITERMATAAGGHPPGDRAALLRAQILLAAALGMTLLRSSMGVQPLVAATEQDLTEPLSDLVAVLLRPGEA
ncbi:TetR family transcriptional regulator [Dactylosporangium sp. McL0621]|uniref:TetR/AcrR family transcriptional regulator n=1 Tax=Dactylosporangium sp. McL0621 TaxID=3415678 RepID=UPI003CF5A91D